MDPNESIYERIVFILPYQASETVQRIQSTFEQINLACLNIKSAMYLNTHELSDRDRQNRLLDYLSGFEVIDL